MALITGALGQGHAGEYQLQAAIAALHDQAASHTATDWSQILTLYELLEAMTGNPMVTLNRAVAAAMAHGPSAGLVAGFRAAAARTTNLREQHYLTAQAARLAAEPAAVPEERADPASHPGTDGDVG